MNSTVPQFGEELQHLPKSLTPILAALELRCVELMGVKGNPSLAENLLHINVMFWFPGRQISSSPNLDPGPLPRSM